MEIYDYNTSEVIQMAFTKADISKEKESLEKLIKENDEACKEYEEFLARIDLQRKLIETRKAERMTQKDVANASGLSQQAVSRIEKGCGATVSSLIKYLSGTGYSIVLRKN
jgi:DNA-binding XRE family transcriptional regulator